MEAFKPKLIEILKNLHHAEVKIYSEASKEFVGLLKGKSGGDILREYVTSSPKCSEILESWRIHQDRPGISHILLLVSAIFDHPSGKSWSSGIYRIINNLAYSIFNEKLDEIYAELNSQEHRRQNAALFLLASIVKRGIGLASEVAKSFDFKLPVLSKLSGIRRTKDARKGTRRSYTRHAFIRFAMSFLEVGNPRLLRWILQRREIYSGVLRGVGGDDVETVVYVLSTLRDKVLVEDSLIPPGLRSVLFGSITLEQLSSISGNPMAGSAANLAHEVLVMACTDPCNGLMPNEKLKGNAKRLFDLMKKLKATESAYHKELLLAIVKGRPSFCATYMDEFPYNLKPRSSSSWISAVCLSADMISTVNSDTLVASVTSHSCDEPELGNHEVQNILKCIVPRPLTRSVISTGLQHADDPVKHGTLRIVLESLKSLSRLMLSIDRMIENTNGKRDDTVGDERGYLHGLAGIDSFAGLDKCLAVRGVSFSATHELGTQKWISLKQLIQDEVRAMLPEPQILLKLISSSGHKHYKHSGESLKRCANLAEVGLKKLKPNNISDDIDIIIGGIDTEHSNDNLDELEAENITQELDVKKDDRAVIAEIWGLSDHTAISKEQNRTEDFFRSKLFDTFKFYLRTVPLAIEGSFDFFKILPKEPSSLPSDLLRSLLSLLLEYIRETPGCRVSARAPKFMYKYLQRLVNILLYSNDEGVQQQAYILARTAMMSTGAFDQNFSEIDAWLSFVSGNCLKIDTTDSIGAESIHDLSAAVSSFLCDSVSTIGNNYYKYLNQMRELISRLENVNDHSLGFSPLIICVLEKCLRLLESESRTYKLSEKSVISLYTCNTISLILQTQVDARTLSGLLCLILTEKFNELPAEDTTSKCDLCEWSPVKNLLCFARDVLNQNRCSFFPISKTGVEQCDGSFFPVLLKIKDLLEKENGVRLVGVAVAFSSSIICATPNDMLINFPLLLTVIEQHFRSYLSFLSWALLIEREFLANVANLWSDMFSSGLKMIEGMISNHRSNNLHLLTGSEILRCLGTADFPDSPEQASSAAFGLFLYNAPFYLLFSAIMSIRNVKSGGRLDVLHSKEMLNLLQLKLSEGSLDDNIASLRNLLFWTTQTISSFRTNSSDILKELLQMCITCLRYLLDRILVTVADTSGLKASRAASDMHCVQDIIDLIFLHPIVTSSLSQPFCFRISVNDVHDIMNISGKFHPIDCSILQILRMGFGFVFSLEKMCNCSSEYSPGLDFSAPRNLIEESLENFKLAILKTDVELFLPRFYMLDVLKQFASPLELLKVVDWMFYRLEDCISGSTSSFVTAAVSVGLYMMDGAFDTLFCYLKQPKVNSEFKWGWNGKAGDFCVSILPNLYHKILEFGTHFNLQCADTCLLKVVSAVYSHRSTKSHPSLVPLYTQLSRMVTSSPMKILLYCCHPASKVKGQVLLQIIEVSPVHMNLFGKIFLDTINNEFPDVVQLNKGGAWPAKCEITDEKSKCAFSNDDYVLLLPAALSYLMFVIQKNEKHVLTPLERIAKFYSGMLLDGFSNWKDYVCQDIFQEEYDESVLTSCQDFCKFFSSTLLGKAVTMLRYSFILNGSQVKGQQLLAIFDSIYSDMSLFDPHVLGLNLGSSSYMESLKIVDAVTAKVSFTRLLLFPPECLAELSAIEANKKSKEWMKREYIILDYAKRFLGILVTAWDYIVTKIPSEADRSDASCGSECYLVFRFLEHYILGNIVQLSMDMQSYLREPPSISILDQFISSSFHHRFEDPLTLRAIRCIIVVLSEAKFSSTKVLALLVRHPKFVSTITGCCGCSDSSSSVPCGTLLQPLPSILKSLDFPSIDQSPPECSNTSNVSTTEMHNSNYSLKDVKLEVVKLLRILYHLKSCQQNIEPVNVDGGNSRELLSLLLSGYGATMSEIDLEIFHLLHEIETAEGSHYGGIADMDYIWGSSAAKLRNELAVHGLTSSNIEADSETIEERRKMLFRENIPVDSKLSVMTVLHFCYDRSSITASLSLKRLLEDKFVDSSEKTSSSNADVVQIYDPAFILRFSNHCLSMAYLEPTEFARLGLLAITFISISSPDEELRKLGYCCLGKFKKLLENYQKRKDILQLQLLLTYIQNGITDEWQRIPSVMTIFAAEASLILLDPSQNHFLTLSEFLMHSHRMNMKTIPLFPKLLKTSSIHFKMDRLWILRLLYAGLNSDIDSEIYKKQEVPKLLLSFCASSLSDHESKILILQIMKKCIKLPAIALCLLKKHGLISWLSSILLFYGERLARDQKRLSIEVIELVLQVINDGISSGTIYMWLQENGLEELSNLSSHLHTLVASSMKYVKGNNSLVNSALSVILWTSRISQNREMNLPQDRKI